MKRQIRNKTLAFQIITFVFFFLLFVFTASYLTTRHLVSRVMLENARESIGYLASDKAHSIDQHLSKIMTLGKNLQILISDNILTGDKLKHHVHHLLINNPELVSVCLSYGNSEGNETTIYQLVQGKIKIQELGNPDFPYKDWYQIPYLTQKNYWSDPWFDESGSGKIVCSYSMPLIRKGRLLGIIRMDTQMENLRRIVLPIRIKQSGYAYLQSYNGTVVAHPVDSLSMNYSIFDIAEILDRPDLRAVGRRQINNESDFIKIRSLADKQEAWMYFKPLASNHWVLVAMVPDSEVFADLRILMLIYLVSSVLSFLIIAAVIYFHTHSINEPLEELVESIKLAGKGVLDTPLVSSSKTYEVQILTDAFELMRESLKDYIHDLQNVTDERNRILNEVAFASAIQKNLVPKNDDPKLRPEQIEAFGILEPAGKVGGDLFDYFMVNGHHFCFGIADVVGKGIGAAMTMTMVTTLLRTIAHQYQGPDKILEHLNDFLIRNNLESNFLTIILGIIDLDTGELVFSNAGHLPLYLLKADKRLVKLDVTNSTALGFFDQISVGSQAVQLEAGDEIVLYTDGITEAMDASDEMFGTAGLENVLNSLEDPYPETTAQAILASVKQFADPDKSQDDITILVVEYRQPEPC